MNLDQTKLLQECINEAETADAVKRAIAVSLLENHMDVSLSGFTSKHAQRLRRDFISKGERLYLEISVAIIVTEY